MPMNNRHRPPFRLQAHVRLSLAICVAYLLAFSTMLRARSAQMHGRIDVIVTSGQLAPDGVSVIDRFGLPVINDKGQLAFTVAYAGSPIAAQDAIVRSGNTGLVQIAAKGQPFPTGASTFQWFGVFPAALNEQGEVGFWSAAASGPMGLFRASSDPIALETIAVSNQTLPDGSGVIHSFGIPSINDHGDIALWAALSSSTFPPGPHGLFRTTFGSELIDIVRQLDPVPNSTSKFWNIGPGNEGQPPPIVPFNNAGEVAFRAELMDGDNVLRGDRGIFRGDGTTLTTIARRGDPDPNGIGTLSGFEVWPSINDLGQVAFHTSIARQEPLQNLRAVYVGDGTSIVQIAIQNGVAPDGNGRFFQFGPIDLSQPGRLALNNRGQVAFPATLIDATDGATAGFFRGDGATLTQVVRLNEVAPGGNGLFSNLFGFPALNDAGQVAFSAQLSDTSGGTTDDSGIFLFDDVLGLIEVVRKGDGFLGSVLTGAGFFGGFPVADEFLGLSQTGTTRLAFVFSLADGRQGIAVWSLLPEGDFNEDGTVDAADYTVWRNGLGTKYTMDDYLVWKNNYGATTLGEGAGSSRSSLSLAPEPGSFVLMGLAAIILGGVRVRRRS